MSERFSNIVYPGMLLVAGGLVAYGVEQWDDHLSQLNAERAERCIAQQPYAGTIDQMTVSCLKAEGISPEAVDNNFALNAPIRDLANYADLKRESSESFDMIRFGVVTSLTATGSAFVSHILRGNRSE